MSYSLNQSMTTSPDNASIGKFIGCFIAVTLIIAIFLNSIVIYGLVKFFRQLDLSGVMVLSLAVSDIIAPLSAYPLSAYSSLHSKWQWGNRGCYWYGFMTTFAGLCSINHLMLLSIERYVTLVLPLRREEILSRNKVYLSLAGCWAFAFAWAIAPVVGWSSYRPEGIQTMCSINWQSRSPSDIIFNVLLIIFCFVVQDCAIVFCHFSTLKELKKMTARAIEGHGANSQTYRDLVQVEKQQSLIVFLMVTGYNFAWIPYAVVSLMVILDFQHLINDKIESIPAMFAKTSTVYNPLIYFVSNKVFRMMLCGRGSSISPSEID